MARHQYQYGKRAVRQKRIRQLRRLLIILLPLAAILFLLFGRAKSGDEQEPETEATESQKEPETESENEESSETSAEDDNQTDPSLETEDGDREPELPLLSFYYYYFSDDEIDGEILSDISDTLIPRGNHYGEVEWLPVYQNPFYRNYAEEQTVDYTSLRNRAEEIKAAFALGGAEGAVDTPGSTGRAPSYTAVTTDYELTVYEGGDVRLSFRKKIDLPPGFQYEYTREKELALVEYYLELLQEPIQESFGWYDTNEVTISYLPAGVAIYYILSYQLAKADTPEEILQAYEFDTLWFYTQSDGLYGLFYGKQRPAAETIIGEYPIISPEKAIEEFFNKNYLVHGSVPNRPIRREDIRGIRLEYFYKAYQPYILPVYVLYISFNEKELPDLYEEGLAEGLETYVRYYVPAVPMKYIEHMETIYFP